MKFINYLSLALTISLLTVGFAVGLPTEGHSHDGQQTSQQTQQPNSTGVKETEKGPASKARYLASVGGYETPITGGYEVPVVQPYVQQQGYGSSYQQPIQSYGTPSYGSSTYQQPIVSSYEQPIQQTYQQPIQQTYQQPIVSSYQQPIVSSYSNYSAPITSSYGGSSYQQPYQQPYQQQSYQQSYQQPYQQPIVSSYQQPIVSNYTSSYQQPIVSSYQQPIVSNYTSSYQQPYQQQSYQQSYQQPYQQQSYQQSYQQPYQQQSYQQPYQQPIVSNYSTPVYTPPVQSYETPIVSSYQQPIVEQTYVAPVQSYGSQQSYQQPYQQQTYQQSYQQPYQQQSYQQSYQQPYQQQSYQQPYQQQSYQQSYQQPYQQQSYQQSYQQPYQQQVGYGGQFTSGFGGQGIGGFGVKRSLSSHESAGAPYSMLVDHLSASASETFTNVSSIECPPQPNPYTCPQMLNLSKEELKQKLCDYENVITGIVSFVPDTEKAQTRCGAMRIIKSDGKSAVADLPEKMAIVLGKECQLKTIMESQQVTKDQVYILTKTSIPAGTKFILADGVNVDMLSAQSIQKEEISAILKSCPAKKGQ